MYSTYSTDTAQKIADRLRRGRETWRARGQHDGGRAAAEVGYPDVAKAAAAMKGRQGLTFERPNGKRTVQLSPPGTLCGHIDLDRPNELPEDFRWDGYAKSVRGFEEMDASRDVPPDKEAYWTGFADALIAITDAVEAITVQRSGRS